MNKSLSSFAGQQWMLKAKNTALHEEFLHPITGSWPSFVSNRASFQLWDGEMFHAMLYSRLLTYAVYMLFIMSCHNLTKHKL